MPGSSAEFKTNQGLLGGGDGTQPTIPRKTFDGTKAEEFSVAPTPDNSLTDSVKLKVGVLLSTFEEKVGPLLENFIERQHADHIVLNLEPAGSYETPNEFRALSDQVASGDTWRTRINLNLGYASLDTYRADRARHFSSLLSHAMYLPTKVLLLDCPTTRLGCLSVASIVNDHLLVLPDNRPLVLFKVPIVVKSSSDKSHSSDSQSNGSPIEPEDGWTLWNYLRGHLNPDSRIGLCLHINENLPNDEEGLKRWLGEPVRIVLLKTDQFTNPTQGEVTIDSRLNQFLEKLTIASSLRISFVLEVSKTMDVTNELEMLKRMTHLIKKQAVSQNRLFSRHNVLYDPCKPLSTNLSSEVYEFFELDDVKYTVYGTAMARAIQTLTLRLNRNDDSRTRVLMVLGAGRGPLVDQFIKAIRETTGSKYRYKIYALDKNKSAVRTLIYKQLNRWKDATGLVEVEVVEADMRAWSSDTKADIIASELLGSFSDNELSPECIDGMWRFASHETICIPQRYTSFVGPVCSYELRQGLHRSQFKKPYDKIHVVKLQSYYEIDAPQPLFDFQHLDISRPPKTFQNERYVCLSFTSKVDTVCHGFAGYFECELYDKAIISTNPKTQTPFLDGWFGAFVPLEVPIPMPKGTKVVLHFWRKMSESKAWYQWAVTEPEPSRVYSSLVLGTSNEGSVMSMISSPWIV